MSRRILFVIPTLEQGGAQKQLALLASGLIARHWDVHVACLRRGGEWETALASAGACVHFVGQQWSFDPRALWRLQRLMRSLVPEIVHCWRSGADGYGRLAAIWAGAPRVFTSLNATKAGIPSGVEPFVAPEKNPREVLLRELGLPAGDESSLVAAIGQLSANKRIKDCIWAAELLKVVRDDVHLLIVGDGPDRWRLERFCRLVGNQDKVHFLGNRGDVPRILPHLLALWSVGAEGGQSNAILEAMAAGLPVIASDTPRHRELVIPNATGFLVPLGDSAALARKTQTLLKDPELRKRLGAAGRAKALNEFTVERMVEAHIAAYEAE
jgi:glycosyltransferase involved in cell wall biosynthesis